MNSRDKFHPGLNNTSATYADRLLRTRVHHIKASELSLATAQTAGMQRLAAITGGSVGSEKIWMGETSVSPQTASDNHHHGESETAIFVRSGNPEFVFHDGVTRSGLSPLRGLHLRAAVCSSPRREPGHRQSCSDSDCSQYTRGNRGESSCVVHALRGT